MQQKIKYSIEESRTKKKQPSYDVIVVIAMHNTMVAAARTYSVREIKVDFGADRRREAPSYIDMIWYT